MTEGNIRFPNGGFLALQQGWRFHCAYGPSVEATTFSCNDTVIRRTPGGRRSTGIDRHAPCHRFGSFPQRCIALAGRSSIPLTSTMDAGGNCAPFQTAHPCSRGELPTADVPEDRL